MNPQSISVCILNYNYGRYLGQAIDSALVQQPGNYRLAEILVVDDGSTDNSLEVCAGYRDRIRTVTREHRGFPGTLTDTIQQAKGDWVALLDADDWFVQDKLATVANAMTNDSLLIQHWEHVVKADGSPLLGEPHVGGNTSTLVVRRDAALDLLPVTNELFFHVFDYFGRGVKLVAPLTHYRVHDSNMTDRTRPGVRQDYMQTVTESVSRRLRALAAAPPAWANERALRRLSWHFAALACGHTCESAIQRDRRLLALAASTKEVMKGLVARRAIMAHLAGMRRAIVMQPALKIGRHHTGS